MQPMEDVMAEVRATVELHTAVNRIAQRLAQLHGDPMLEFLITTTLLSSVSFLPHHSYIKVAADNLEPAVLRRLAKMPALIDEYRRQKARVQRMAEQLKEIRRAHPK